MIKPRRALKHVIVPSIIASMMMTTSNPSEVLASEESEKKEMKHSDLREFRNPLTNYPYQSYHSAIYYERYQNKYSQHLKNNMKERTVQTATDEQSENQTTLRQGSKGPEVTSLQTSLNTLGLYTYNIDGIYGAITTQAVISFQLQQNIKVDGVAGPQTFEALEKVIESESESDGDLTLRKGSKGPAVRYLQEQLKDLGYHTFKVDGIYGPRTAESVSQFQDLHRLTVDGIAGPETFKALHDQPRPATQTKANNKSSSTIASGQSSQSSGQVSNQSSSSAQESDNQEISSEMTVESTAYTAYCEGCSGITRTGLDLRNNPDKKVIAVDPNVIPLGSRVYVEGYGEAIAADTGGAIKGNMIDVFIPNRSEALKWGRQNVSIKILE